MSLSALSELKQQLSPLPASRFRVLVSACRNRPCVNHLLTISRTDLFSWLASHPFIIDPDSKSLMDTCERRPKWQETIHLILKDPADSQDSKFSEGTSLYIFTGKILDPKQESTQA